MAELSFIENIEAEKTNLELHVDLCAQRYNQLINKFDEVDHRLNQLTKLCSEIKDSVVTLRSNTQTTYLKWAGFIIVVLTGILGGLVGRLI
jgi:peptidoglycan hydrolase CwlO-like protein